MLRQDVGKRTSEVYKVIKLIPYINSQYIHNFEIIMRKLGMWLDARLISNKLNKRCSNHILILSIQLTKKFA